MKFGLYLKSNTTSRKWIIQQCYFYTFEFAISITFDFYILFGDFIILFVDISRIKGNKHFNFSTQWPKCPNKVLKGFVKLM